MKNFIFYKINNHHILLNSNGDEILTASSESPKNTILDLDILLKIPENGTIEKHLASKVLNLEKNSDNYLLMDFNSYAVLLERRHPSIETIFSTKENTEEKVKFFGNYLSVKFREQQKDLLLKKVANDKIELQELIKFLSRQCFCDEYSLWSYDKINNLIIHECSSIEYPEQLRFKSSECGISRFLESTDEIQTKTIDENFLNSSLLKEIGLKSISRFKIDFEQHKISLVVSFYSKRENFYVSKQLMEQYKNIVKFKYFEVIDKQSEKVSAVISALSPKPESDQLDVYLHRACKTICSQFKYEACSIFIIDNTKKKLKLRATVDAEIKDQAKLNIFYKTKSESLTAKVFNEQKTLLCPNGIATLDKNSHTYDEKTDLPPKNWIGTPLTLANNDFSEPIGVLRVKNKYSNEGLKKAAISIKSIYIQNLMEVANYLSSIVSLFITQDKVKKDAAQQREYTKVLMHEIRSPIFSIQSAPEIVRNMLKTTNLPREKLESIHKKLWDVEILSDRMTHLTRSYNLSAMLAFKKIQPLSILRDIIYPTTYFLKPYIDTQYDKLLEIDHDSLRLMQIHSDQILLSMALNALIENAAKYSLQNSKIVRIEGKSAADSIEISVINYGISISREEEASMYKGGFRGKKAIEEKIHGTGIGLYLCKKIMSELGGDIYLKRDAKNKAKIEFVLKL